MGDEPSPMAAMPAGFLARFVLGQIRSALFPQTISFGFLVAPEWIEASKKASGKETNRVHDAADDGFGSISIAATVEGSREVTYDKHTASECSSVNVIELLSSDEDATHF